MKILVIASTFPAHDDDPVPAFVRDQIIALKKADPELSFAVLAPHDKRSNTKSFTRHDAYDEYRFHYFWPFGAEKLAGRGIMPALKANPLNYLLIPFLFAGEFFALLSLIQRFRPDLLYAHWFTPQAINARLAGALTGIPFVFTTHASDVDVWHKIPFFGPRIVRGNARKARAFTAVSRRSMAKLERFFESTSWDKLKTRSAIIPMGVDLPATTQVKPISPTERTILFIGRLAEKKGVQYLLPAFSEVSKQASNVRLVIAGDGPMRGELEDQAKELGLTDRVTFPGFVSGDAKWNLLQAADLYVVPSIITKSGDAEGLPVSLMEGLAYGKVCIATNESGADDILTDGVDGFLIPQQDSTALANKIIQALNLSDEAVLTIQSSAQATATQFSWQTIADQYKIFFFS